MKLTQLIGMNNTVMRTNTKPSDVPLCININRNSFEKQPTLRDNTFWPPKSILLLLSTFSNVFQQPVSNISPITSFYNCETFRDAHYCELEAQLRAYKRCVTESELGLARENGLRKRAQIHFREATEEHQEYRKRTKTKIVRLQQKLRDKSEALKDVATIFRIEP